MCFLRKCFFLVLSLIFPFVARDSSLTPVKTLTSQGPLGPVVRSPTPSPLPPRRPDPRPRQRCGHSLRVTSRRRAEPVSGKSPGPRSPRMVPEPPFSRSRSATGGGGVRNPVGGRSLREPARALAPRGLAGPGHRAPLSLGLSFLGESREPGDLHTDPGSAARSCALKTPARGHGTRGLCAEQARHACVSVSMTTFHPETRGTRVCDSR